IVTAEKGHRSDRGPLPDVLARFACDGKIKSPLDFDHSCSPIERFWILGTGKASSVLPGTLPCAVAISRSARTADPCVGGRHYNDGPAGLPAKCLSQIKV